MIPHLRMLACGHQPLNLFSLSAAFLLLITTASTEIQATHLDLPSSLPFTRPNPSSLLETDVGKNQSAAVELLALIDFKSRISADPLYLLSNWNTSQASPCNWTGIMCDNASRVVGLDLKASNLTGTITPQLGNLSHLTYLNLSINNFHGEIPPELGQLRALTHLDFKQNQLQGMIPPELGDCQALMWLDLSHNQLNGTIPSSLGALYNLYMLQLHDITNLTGSIPPEIGQLKYLTYLYLGSNNLVGSIPPELGQLTNLRELWLILNKLNGSIPPQLGQLENLEVLALFLNSFQGSIPAELGNLTNLKYMWLLNCNLEGSIPPELGGLRRLQELDLSNNRLSGGIPAQLGQLENLVLLKLFSNNLNGGIPRQIGNLTKLQHLYLFSNNLFGMIPWELGQLENLQNLYLYSNNLTGSLPAELGQLQELQTFIVFSNNLSGELPRELGEMKSLIIMYVGNNSFSGRLPLELGKLANLQYLEMRFCSMDGEIPSSLGNLTNLVYVDLSNNMFSGAVPSVLANCTKLQWIKLGKNFLSGGIPQEYSSLHHLHTLSLRSNNLTGKVPSFFANHSSLVVLDLQHNQLAGGLPDSWGHNENLRVLSLGYNHLVGSLPAWLWSLSQLQLLDLSNNNFTGTIPHALEHMDGFKHNETAKETLWQDVVQFAFKGTEADFTYVLAITTSLDLSGNKLAGEIPQELGLLNGLVNLNLSSNNLTGSIPVSLGNILPMESLDLSNNMLNGSIPTELVGLTALAFLNLSNNHLSGQIPQANQFGTFTNQSYLGNSNLCGFPLSSSCSALSPEPASAPTGGSGQVLSRNAKIGIAVGVVFVAVTLGMILFGFVFYSSSRGTSYLETQKSEVQFFGKRLILTTEELYRATDGYNEDSIIGKGGSSIVYRGVLRDGTVVAVKMLNHVEAQKSFFTECATLGQIRHRNLVRILGTYTTLDTKALILEYMPNGSLDMHLYRGEVCELNWEIRLKIATGVAQGMSYLHSESGFAQILHCDLKPSNILLDMDFEPHISDFGIARLIASGKDGSTLSSALAGSIGYVAPEYAYTQKVTEKADVYSYGIILLEMVTRKRPTSEMFAEGMNLPRWVRSTFPKDIIQVIDPVLHRDASPENYNEIHCVLTLGLLCTREMPNDRPTMKDVLDVLLRLRIGSSSNALQSNVNDLISTWSTQDIAQHYSLVMSTSSSAISSLFSVDNDELQQYEC